ncbi:MAG: glycosyltransferase family 4 protein [Acidobacteria bacterium]|nr:glycosyltransferase family 4 protein [Acidobacteriota bacterium]
MNTGKPLHICLVSEEYPPDTGWGGIGTYTYNVARGLALIGHRVEIVAGCLDAARDFTEHGIRVRRIGFAPPGSGLKRAAWRAFQAWTRDLRYFRRKLEFARAALGLFRRVHAEDPFDVVEAAEYDANAYFIARRRLAPLVVKIHTPVLLNTHLNALPVTREVRWCDRLERSEARHATVLTTPSRRMAEHAEKWLRGRRPEVVANPIDTAEFSPAPEGQRAEYDFFYTGRLEKRKGVHLLLEAFRKVARDVPGTRLVLAGHDTPTFPLGGKALHFMEFAEHQGLLEGLADRVVFLGRVDRRELPHHYRRSRVCVFPSERFENFPYSCLEAMACGRAVIVSDSGGMTEMMEDGRSGLKVPVGSVDALAGAMLRLAASPAEAEAMGREARLRVESRYTLERVARETEAVYRKAVGRRP